MFRNRIILALFAGAIGIAGATALMMSATGGTDVADAAKRGDKAAVLALLKEAADVNAAQGDGMTALHWAASKGDAEMTQTLLYAGANVKAATRLGGYTPLFMAAERGSASVAGLLLKAGANPKARAGNGLTPLMTAAMGGDPDTLKVLLENGAEVNAIETDHGQTALSFAAAFDRSDAIRLLISNGGNANLASKVVAAAPVVRDFTQIPAPLPATPAAPGATPAAGAPAATAPAAVGPRGQRAGGAAPAAAAGGRGAAGQPAPAPAAAAAAPDPAPRSGGNPKGGFTPMMYAARQGAFTAVKTLVEGGAGLDVASGDKSTALLLAIINGHFDIAKYLVEKGANVTLASMDGATPLYVVANTQWARKSFHPQPSPRYSSTTYLDLMTMMLDRGANPNARLTKDLWYSGYNFGLVSANAAGTTAIWKCAEVGDLDGMKLLIARGADPLIPSNDGVTALLIATGAGVHGNDDVSAPSGRMPAVKYLIEELHADVNAADTGGNARVGVNAGNDMVIMPLPGTTPAAAGGSAAAAATQAVAAQAVAAAAPPPVARAQNGGFTALHNAAARGDNEMILYLISRGAKTDAVSKSGVTVADMANGPRQRVQPYPETVALLEMLGSRNSHKCVSC